MKNMAKIKTSSTPAWHIGVQAFIALLVILIVPLTISVKDTISALTSNIHITSNTQKKIVAEQPKTQNKNTLTRFLAAAVFGVNPDTNVVENPTTGDETIILPYGGEINSGGTLPGSGNLNTDKWVGNAPYSDGSVPVIDKYQYALQNATTTPINSGGTIGGTDTTNSGGTINAGGSIKSGGTI
jgi:hypothetical protein